MGLQRCYLSTSIKLASNPGVTQPATFAGTRSDTATITGLRTSARIENSGAPADCRATVRIWGLRPSMMNQLSTLGLVFNLVPKNTLTLSAGTDPSALQPVFSGTIYYAYGDYASQPDVPFVLECLSGVADAVAPAQPTSYTGAADVATIMGAIARQLNLGFENNGVKVTLNRPYLYGSLRTQAQRVAEAAGIEWGIFEGQKLAIWPRGGNRDTPDVPVISPGTGMISYPTFTQQGIIVKSVFDPKVSFGSLIEIDSSLLQATAAAQPSANFPTRWAVNKLDLALDAEMPHGQWMSVVYAYNPGYSRGIIPPAGGK